MLFPCHFTITTLTSFKKKALASGVVIYRENHSLDNFILYDLDYVCMIFGAPFFFFGVMGLM